MDYHDHKTELQIANVWFKKISIHPPQRVTGNSKEGGGGLQRPKFLKESKSLNWNFQRGGGFKPKNPPWGGGGVWNNTM